ncbi:hypothetical protein NA57DRAFT_75984 [Rhizodiscina lignyota]|uniref:HAUS augmin-like complex subunit 6 N-terminal domain-containing protein n=1 Tax=Rhizodiscina lignyota TaxID=1504668 RepID=A0A9P4IID9_9PEZI|nr:hypothetical protein NA57DRAFT_75984 [Rhizodiscina lignyota]
MSRTLSATSTNGHINGSKMTYSPPSNVALFLTNLRLLDFDIRPDWPSITNQTFSTRDAGQNQKQQIRCVEWALYRLFEIWDPDETRDKLQPFFPPLEPLQSLNLRAALYRSLNELKKNGLLGREATLRKTMLDDCKGDKFTEVLAVFSTLVVKKRVAPVKHMKQAPVALKTAVTNVPDAIQQRSLLPLAIAHKGSLVALLRRRDALKGRYASFSNSLDAKAQQLEEREQSSRASSLPSPPNSEVGQLQKQLTDSWVGNTNWIDIILHGEDDTGDQVLRQPFEAVWYAASNGRQLETAVTSRGLQADLENRVEQQKKRLAYWHGIHHKVKDRLNTQDSGPTNANVSGISFTQHKGLKIGGEAEYEARGMGHDPPSRTEPNPYSNLLSTMKHRLANVSATTQASTDARHALSPLPAKSPILSRPMQDRRKDSPVSDTRPRRNRELRSFNEPEAVQLSRVSTRTTASPDTKDPPKQLFQELSGYQANARVTTGAQLSPLGRAADNEGENNPQAGQPPHDIEHQKDSPITDASQFKATEEELRAQKIIAAIPNETPLPTQKPAMSLTERTRLSIAHSLPQFEKHDASSVSNTEVSHDHDSHDTPSQPSQELSRRASLLERTRLSMSRLPTGNPPGQKSRKSMAPSTAKRRSLYPVNQFETPRRQPSFTLTEEVEEGSNGSTTPKEILFSGDAEYDSVFKSRPRVALSPVFSPQDVGAGSPYDGAMDSDTSLVSSPLGRVFASTPQRKA